MSWNSQTLPVVLEATSQRISILISQDFNSMKNITVIGSGTMGNGIAHLFAQQGFSVVLVDLYAEQLTKAVATISKNMDRQVNKGILS